MGWPREMGCVRLYRMASAELIIQGTPSSRHVGQVRDAFLNLVQAAGFRPYREFEHRTGSAILPLIVITTEPATQKEAEERAEDLLHALQQRANLKKTGSETLLNLAKAFSLVIGSLGLVVNLALRFPDRAPVSPESGKTIEWSNANQAAPKIMHALKLKGSRKSADKDSGEPPIATLPPPAGTP